MHLWSMFVDLLRAVNARSAPPEPQRQPHERRPDLEPPREVVLLRAAERDAIVASHLNTPLQALGFVQVAPRRWVDGSSAPVRRMFEMQLLKGAAMKARWGFSLDFVPHLSGDRVCWHRSNRTAMFDVFVDLGNRPYASFLYGAPWLHHCLERLVPTVLERAQETWRRGLTPAGVLEIVREVRERKINSFYVYFNWHLPLSFMFLSAKIGDLTAAEAELDAFAREYELAEDVVAKLARRLRDLAPVENGQRQS